MKTGRLVWFGLASAGLAAAIAVGAAVFIARIPPVTQQIKPGEMFITLRLSEPRPGADLALNTPVRVTVFAEGQSPLRRLELWADGEMVGDKDVPEKTRVNAINTSWNWTPTRAGSTNLVVRAFDAANHIALSKVVSVKSSANPVVRHILQGGETLDSLALQNNTSAEAIVAANPGLKASDALPEGAGIYLPAKAAPAPAPAPGSGGSAPNAPPPAPPTNGPGGIQTDLLYNTHIIPENAPVTSVSGDSVNKLNFWAINQFGAIWNGPAKIYPYSTQPTFDVSVQGCNANVRIQPPGMPGVDVQTYLLYRLDPFSTSYKLLAALPGSGKLVEGYLDSNLYGKFSYYLTALMAPDQQQITSAIVDINVTDKACNKGQWSSLVVTQAKLSTSDPMGGGVYCYLMLNDTPWARLPDKTGTIPFMVGSDYDLKPYMPNIVMAPLPDPIDISLECWGVNGGQATSLGTGTGSFGTGGPAAVEIKGSGFSALLVFDRGAPTPGQQLAPSTLTPPTALRMITSQQDCLSHLGPGPYSLNPCDYIFDPGQAYFAWEWSPASCPGQDPISSTCGQDNQIDSFNIYSVGNDGSFYRVDDVPSSRKTFEYPRPLSGNECFVVRSAKNYVTESVNSNIACAPGSAVRAIKIDPVELYTETVSNQAYQGCGPFAPPSNGISNSFAQSKGPVNAGYNYSNFLFNPAPFFSCKVTNDHYSRAVLQFDLWGFDASNPIQKAAMSFDRTSPAACGTTLNTVTGTNGYDVVSFNPLVTINPGSSHSLDVTQLLTGNYGAETNGEFMINSNYENAHALDSKQCSETFNNFSLMLTFPNW